ncbi:hypothetical protein AB1K83_09465 [Sporosarcina sp. 179-K 3D1 HS]|uniref:hypothetical protein n=1 Tax=Sporosarcina sp. 179-K 3D1 HS TaxID=3232169 RepID=UPI0039A18DD0
MEKFELYVPNLRNLLENKRGCKGERAKLLKEMLPEMNAVFLPEEKRLYISSLTYGNVHFQLVSFDLENDKITFQRRSGSAGDGHRWIFELLSTLQWDFLPKQMSYVMERPPQHIIEEKT